MAYVHRRVVAGQTVEHRKMQSYRVHTKGVKRGPNKGTTTEKQAKINERVAEEHLRWDINANFKHKDLHAVLHYIEEWFDYGGDPHHFRAYVGQDGGPVDPTNLEELRRILGSVKRLSSWMDEIITISSFDPAAVAMATAMGKGYMETTLPEAPVDYHMEDTQAHPGGIFGTITTTAIKAAE